MRLSAVKFKNPPVPIRPAAARFSASTAASFWNEERPPRHFTAAKIDAQQLMPCTLGSTRSQPTLD